MENTVLITDAQETKTRTITTRRMRCKSGKRLNIKRVMRQSDISVVETVNTATYSEAYAVSGSSAVAYISQPVPVIESSAVGALSITESPAFVQEQPSSGNKTKPVYDFFKRIFDICASGIAIILLSPVMLILAFLVKCTSKGPVFYVSDRVGQNGKTFKFLKFRSMCVDADQKLDDLLAKNEAEGGVIFKMKDDPRVTKFGKFIRKTSLDELPQLFNIFVGDMSVVGPRPCTTREYSLYSERDKQRLQVKQGLTCIWQCSGRSNTTFKEQIEMDIKYIEHRGFWYDIWLILKTVVAVFKHDGAL